MTKLVSYEGLSMKPKKKKNLLFHQKQKFQRCFMVKLEIKMKANVNGSKGVSLRGTTVQSQKVKY